MGGHPVDAAADHAGRAHIGGAVDPEGHDAPGEPWHPSHNPFVVRVGHEQGASRRPLEDFGFRVRDGVDRGEMAQMRFAHVGPHPHVRVRHPHQRADFSDVIHPQLDDRDLRAPPQLDEGQRQPDVIVEVSAVASHPVPQREKLTRDFLRRGLPGTAGDGHHFRSRLASNGVGQRLQRHRCIVDLDTRRLRRTLRAFRPPPRDQDTGSPCGDRRLGEHGAIESLAANRDEEIPGRQRACVNRHAAERLGAVG